MGFSLSAGFGGGGGGGRGGRGGGEQDVRIADIRDLGLGSEFVAVSGATFQQQDQGGSGDIPYFEINNQSDQIDFDISELLYSDGDTIIEINTIWGSTEFEVVDRDNSSIVISDVSGFDSDVWHADVSLTGGQLRITNFQDTQAAIQPFIKVLNGG